DFSITNLPLFWKGRAGRDCLALVLFLRVTQCIWMGRVWRLGDCGVVKLGAANFIGLFAKVKRLLLSVWAARCRHQPGQAAHFNCYLFGAPLLPGSLRSRKVTVRLPVTFTSNLL